VDFLSYLAITTRLSSGSQHSAHRALFVPDGRGGADRVVTIAEEVAEPGRQRRSQPAL
jgi:hypothetical protein